MNRSIVPVIVFLMIASCHQQSNNTDETAENRVARDEITKNIYSAGDSMLAAFKRKDWKTFVRYNNPNMTKRMGGIEAFSSLMKMQMKQIPDTAIKSITLGKVLQVVTTSKDQQCVVEQIMKMEQNGVQLDKTTYLVGESLDNGKTWTFFDASTKTGLSPKEIKPDLSNELRIPATKNEVQ